MPASAALRLDLDPPEIILGVPYRSGANIVVPVGLDEDGSFSGVFIEPDNNVVPMVPLGASLRAESPASDGRVEVTALDIVHNESSTEQDIHVTAAVGAPTGGEISKVSSGDVSRSSDYKISTAKSGDVRRS